MADPFIKHCAHEASPFSGSYRFFCNLSGPAGCGGHDGDELDEPYPAVFKEIVDEVTLANANIVEVVHDRLSSDIDAGSAGVTLSLETQGQEQADVLIKALEKKNIKFTLLT